MNLIQRWRKSWQRQASPTASEIRRQLAAVRSRQEQVTAEQDAIALDAMRSDAAAARYQQFDADHAELARQIQILQAALPHAERQEAEAAKQVEADALARRIEDF